MLLKQLVLVGKLDGFTPFANNNVNETVGVNNIFEKIAAKAFTVDIFEINVAKTNGFSNIRFGNVVKPMGSATLSFGSVVIPLVLQHFQK